MQQKSNIKINLSGGLVSPTRLLTLLKIAQWAGVEAVNFGARQQLLMFVHPREMELFSKKMSEEGIDFETVMDTFPNISSSYSFAELFPTATEGWVSEGMYLDIFSTFDYKPTLKINISDATQSHAPLFTGHLNFISSDVPHYWFCYIRLPKTNQIERFPNLIYTHDIAHFAKQVEVQVAKDATQNRFYTEGVIMREIQNDLEIPRFVMPYYEGINVLSSGKLWLGMYRRDDHFPINFLIEMCQFCNETRIGNIGISHWRSLVIKGIEKKDRFKWEKLLGKHGINVRHANNELNWQTEDDAPEGAVLKHYLVKKLDKLDLRTFGLVFAIKTRHKSEVFGSVIIRREPFMKIGTWEFDAFGLLASYNIFYAQDFNPHTRKRKTFRLGVPKSRLADEILLLSKKFYKELTAEKKSTKVVAEKKTQLIDTQTPLIHRCQDCWTVYNVNFGTDTDLSRANREGVAFDDLSADFECPTCSAPKSRFELIKESQLLDLHH